MKKGECKLENFQSGFGARRKRFIDVSDRANNSNGITYHGIQWENDNQQKEDFKELDYHESDEENILIGESSDIVRIDGIPIKLKPTNNKKKFSDTHVRITTYLEKDLHQTIQMMNNQGYINSITQIINDSVKSYLLDNYRK